MYSKSYRLLSFLLGIERKLTVSSEYVELVVRKGEKRTRLTKSEITDFTYSIDYISVKRITIGKRYRLSIRGGNDDTVLKVEFISYFNTRREYSDFYSEIVAALKKYYFKDIVAGHLATFHANGELKLGKLHLSKEGINVMGTGLDFVWPNLKIKEYPHYFVISKPNAPEFHLWLVYDEWFSSILYVLITSIKKEMEKNALR